MKQMLKTTLKNMPSPARVSQLAIASRVAAAIFGGYALALLASIVLVTVLPGSRADGVLGATQLSFAIYSVTALWVFSAHSAMRAWLGILLLAAILAPIAWMLTGGARL